MKVVPKSSKTEFAGFLPDGTWKIRIAAAPEKGKANIALCEFLAEYLGVARSRCHNRVGCDLAPKTRESGVGGSL